MHYFTYAAGYIVTANRDGTIPLNSKIVTAVPAGDSNGAFVAVLIEQANMAARRIQDELPAEA